jgi:hypothetical protein
MDIRALLDIRALPLLFNSTALQARGRKQGVGQLVRPVMPARDHLCNPWLVSGAYPLLSALLPSRSLPRMAPTTLPGGSLPLWRG